MKSPFNMRMKLKDYPGAIQFYDDLEAKRPLTEQEVERRRQLRIRQSTALGQKKYREKNKEKVKKAQETWRAKNVKKRAQYSKEWCADHAAHVSARAKAWREKNPDKVAAGKRRQALVRQRERFFRAIGLCLNCKIVDGQLVPLTAKQKRAPLLLPAPSESHVFSLGITVDSAASALGMPVPVVGLALKAA